MNKNLIWMGTILAVGLLSFYAGSSLNAGNANAISGNVVLETTEAQQLDKATEFSLQTIDGESISLKENIQNDKPTVIYFMSSTCSTCAKNWEAMNEAYPEFEGEVDLIAVSVDPTDTDNVLKKLRDDKGLAFDMSKGNPKLALDYGVKKQTAKFAIDGEGNILERHDGALTVDEWKEFFNQL